METTRIIAIISQKGGVGKTSLVQNLGAELAERGQRVLMIDFDPQANLTEGWGIDPWEQRPTIYHAMTGDVPTADARITVRPNLDLLPASLNLAGADPHFAGSIDRHIRLQKALRPVEAEYDFILIDGPPSLGFFVNSALMAANEIIIPLQVHGYAFMALDPLMEIVEAAQGMNEGLRITGVVLTMYDRRNNLSATVAEAARERFETLVYQTVIPINVKIAEAPLVGKPVAEYDSNSTGAVAYRELAKEVLDGREG